MPATVRRLRVCAMTSVVFLSLLPQAPESMEQDSGLFQLLARPILLPHRALMKSNVADRSCIRNCLLQRRGLPIQIFFCSLQRARYSSLQQPACVISPKSHSPSHLLHRKLLTSELCMLLLSCKWASPLPIPQFLSIGATTQLDR